MARLGHGAADFLSSRFRTGVTISDEATAILRERCPSAVWELDTSQMFAAWCLFYCGEVAELRVRCPRIAKEGRERGDMYLETTVNQFPRVATLLGDDDPEQARHLARESIAKWSQQGFHVQHLTAFYGQMLIDLYNGDALGAWRRVTSTWPELEASLLMKIQHVYIDSLQYSGRAALAAARQWPIPPPRCSSMSNRPRGPSTASGSPGPTPSRRSSAPASRRSGATRPPRSRSSAGRSTASTRSVSSSTPLPLAACSAGSSAATRVGS